MPSRLTEITVDCAEPQRLAEFWCAALGFTVIDSRPDLIEIGSWEPTVERVRAEQMPPTVLFVRVPEGKTSKNRLHLDLSPIDGTTEEEVDRLCGLGAQRVDVGQRGDEGWTVLADPEGNEFCVLRSLRDRG